MWLSGLIVTSLSKKLKNNVAIQLEKMLIYIINFTFRLKVPLQLICSALFITISNKSRMDLQEVIALDLYRGK